MTDSERLREIIKNSGYKMKFLALSLNITPYGFQRKVDGVSDFNAAQIKILCKLLEIKLAEMEQIFFADSVEKSATL
jgi:hypothetical protein